MSFYNKEHIQDLDVFLVWVECFQIGSGLNDNQEFAGNFFRGLLDGGYEDVNAIPIIQRQLHFLQMGLYTAYDGFVPRECTQKILTPLAKDLINLGWNRKLSQVKLKFDELRFYVYDSNESIQERIYKAMVEWQR